MSTDRAPTPSNAREELQDLRETVESHDDDLDDLKAGYERAIELTSTLEAENDRLREELELLREEYRQDVRELRREIDTIRSRIEDEDVDLDAKTTLEKYAAMPEEVREETLGSSDRRAVAIFENWFDLAKDTDKGWDHGGGNGWVVSTARNPHKKNSPSDLKPTLSNIVDEDLEWTEVYRAMKALAKLSGGEHMVDDYDREHVIHGAIEFHEKPTADGDQMRKRLVCKDESILEEVPR